MFVFRPLEPSLPRGRFDCGTHELNKWFWRQAGQQDRRNTARTHTGLDTFGSEIASYFSLVTYRVELEEAAQAAEFSDARYPLSAILIARLAVDKRYQGKGVGALTLGHALRLLHEHAQDIAFEVVVVHAIDAAAAAFYRKHGFSDMTKDGRLLYVTTKSLAASMSAAEQ